MTDLRDRRSTRNPLKFIRDLEVAEKPFVWLQSAGEVQKLLGSCNHNIRTLVAVLVGTGMRLDEALHLMWVDIDLQYRVIHVHRGRRGAPKSGRMRHVPIFDSVLTVLREMKLAKGENTLLWPGAKRDEKFDEQLPRDKTSVFRPFKAAVLRAGTTARVARRRSAVPVRSFATSTRSFVIRLTRVTHFLVAKGRTIRCMHHAMKRIFILVSLAVAGCSTLVGLRSPGDSASQQNCGIASITNSDLQAKFELLRCPEKGFGYGSEGDDGALRIARREVRPYLDNQIGPDQEEWPRAIYVEMCRRELAIEGRKYPAMALTCLYQAQVLDLRRLEAEASKLTPADRKVVVERSTSNVAEVERMVTAAFPRAENARDWEILHAVPLRLRDEARAREKVHTRAYQVMRKFIADAEKGEWKQCEAMLEPELTAYVRPALSTLPAAVERMTDPLGYALAESLARCYYYNERLEKASALLATLEPARRRVTLAEQIYYAQIDLVQADGPGAGKFPNLVGKKYTSVTVDAIAGMDAFPSEMEAVWRKDRRTYAKPIVSAGRIAKVEKRGDGAVVHFVKEKLPEMDLDCRETNKVDRIDSEGRIEYRQECTSKQNGWYWSAPEPVKIDAARGLAVGRYVRIAVREDRGGILSCTDGSIEKPGRVYRLADVTFQ